MNITRVGGYSPVTNRSVSSSGLYMPNVPDSITTKGQSKLSESEIKEKLLEMARRDVANGVQHDNPYRSKSAEWLKLEQDYMSFASPDRKGIINNTLSGLAQRLNERLDGYLDLLDAIMKNSRLFGSKDIGDNFINFKDILGNVVASYSQQPNGSYGFTEYPTNAEISRSHEFMQMWRDAQVQAGDENHGSAVWIELVAKGKEMDIGAKIAQGTPLNMKMLEAHGITFDAETGQTHVDRAKLEQTYNQSYLNSQQKINVRV